MLTRTAKSCGPDAPTLASSSRRLVGPTGRGQNLNPLDDGGKRARSPGRARHKPLKPLRAGMPGDSGVLVYSCAFYYSSAHEAAVHPRRIIDIAGFLATFGFYPQIYPMSLAR